MELFYLLFEVPFESNSIDPIFQHDGEFPHFYLHGREYLNNPFPSFWIRHRGFIEWSPKSPDLIPFDFLNIFGVHKRLGISDKTRQFRSTTTTNN